MGIPPRMNPTFQKAAKKRMDRLRAPDSETLEEEAIDRSSDYTQIADTEKQLHDEEMPGLMKLHEADRDSRIKRAAEYKQFSDDAKLSALERARRGELPIRQGEGSEDAMREALPVIRGREREKMEALKGNMIEEQ